MIDLGNDEYSQDNRIPKKNRRRYGAIIIMSIAVGIAIIWAATLRNGEDVAEDVPQEDDDEGYVSVGLGNLSSTLSFHISPQRLAGSYITDVLKNEERNNPEAFQDPHSYQNKAASWLQANPNVNEISSSTKRIRQRYALACLYYATNAVANAYTSEMFGLMVNESTPTWLQETGWLQAINECEWFGVECTSGFVTKINLPSNRLTGSLPHELAILKDTLEELQLFENSFHNVGEEGHAWLGQMQRLTFLSLGRSLLEYDNGIPLAIGQLTSLRDLELSELNYTGQIQEGVFSDLTSLEYLNMDGNAFGGSVPREITVLPNLQYLHAKGTLFEDDISFAQNMSALKALWMDDNPGLMGDVSVLEGVVTLESLSVQGTGVTGTIPSFVCAGEVFLDCSDQLCGCDCNCK